MRPSVRFIAALLFLAVAACPAFAAGLRANDQLAAQAEQSAFGIAYSDLYRIDLGTRVATYLGTTGLYGGQLIGQMRGLSYGPDGGLYGVSGNLKALFKINASNGVATYVGPLGLVGTGQFGALDLSMTYGCNGQFWLSSAVTGQLWKVDPQTATPTLVGSMGHKITGIVAYGDMLYGASGQGETGFYSIDKNTAQATLIGNYGSDVAFVNVVALSFDSTGTLYTSLSYNPGATSTSPLVDWSDLATIDIHTGAVTKLGAITGPVSRLRGVSMNGFVVAPTQCDVGPPPPPPPTPYSYTPVPSGSLPMLATLALLLLGAGLLGQLVIARTRRR